MAETKSSPRRPIKRARCAIYTRKSTEEGLEKDFNSLEAQREACAAFIQSQKHEGWTGLSTAYDDGGYSGGTMERPALQRLLADIEAGRIDVIVVYKVDRLTRALSDFAKLVEVFDRRGVSFVSITQQFNTTTSMGRLTLNILLSFAQFERELIGERVRDKVAASKKKGMWMGGTVPLGYDAKDRKLVINKAEARTVVDIYRRYLRLKSVRALQMELDAAGIRSKQRIRPDGTDHGNQRFSQGALYLLLQNRTYRGEATHKGNAYPGEHSAIIEKPLWDAVQAVLAENRVAAGDWRQHQGAKPADWAPVRRGRGATDADMVGQEGHTVPVLRVHVARERWQQSPFDAPSYPRREPRNHRHGQASKVAFQPRRTARRNRGREHRPYWTRPFDSARTSDRRGA